MPRRPAAPPAARRRAFPLVGAVATLVAVGVVIAALLAVRGEAPAADRAPRPAPTLPSPCTTPGPGTTGKKSFAYEPCFVIDEDKLYVATFTTSMGKITATLEPKIAPRTVNNFVFLARQGFYDGTIFHMVQNVKDPNPAKDYAIVQGGDPAGTGAGGPGYSFGEPPPPITRYLRGNLVMARKRAANTNGSQFFFVVRDWEELEPQYTFFGVVEEQDDLAVLDAMADTAGEQLPGGLGLAPNPAIRLTSVEIEEIERA